MTSQTLVIWWIDDEPERLRKSARRRIEKPTDPTLKGQFFATLTPKLLKDEAQRLALEMEVEQLKASKRLPHLIIIDQILNRNDGVLRRGSSIAVALRAQAPTIPFVGTSAASPNDVAELQKDQFIEFFCLEDLQSGDRIPDLFAIATGFRVLIASKPQSGDSDLRRLALLKLLKCPKFEMSSLSACVPGEFFGPWDDETPHVIARWVWHTLLGRPGFLNDDLEIATLLGLSLSGFKKIHEQLVHCKYTGILASASRRRWWVSLVAQSIRKSLNANATDPLWKLGRCLIPRALSTDFSRCHGSKDSNCVPDAVAFEDETRSERVQTRIEDSEPVETDTAPVGFEQYRFYKG